MTLPVIYHVSRSWDPHSGLLSCLPHPLQPARYSGLLLAPVFLFPVASELFNHMSFPPIGCGLSFGTQINAC